MIGRNVIGRIYRPQIIKNFSNGFCCISKFKSNFGGEFPIDIKIYCEDGIFIEVDNFAVFENNQQIFSPHNKLKISDIKIDKVIKPDYRNTKLTGRKILKNNEKGIVIPISFFNQSNDELYTLDLSLYTTIIDNKEYIAFKLDEL